MKISKLLLWKDVGFNDGSVEVPSYAECRKIIDSTADKTLENLAASANRMFSELKLPLTYTEAREYSYLKMEYDDKSYYGWIDSVEIVSDTVVDEQHRYSEVLVRWHVDLWRTYYTSASLGYGLVSSRPAQSTDPQQSISYRYRRGGEYRSLIPNVIGTDVNWLIFTYTKENTSHQVTTIRTCSIPIDKNNLDQQYKVRLGDREANTPSLRNVISGEFLTSMGISASQITSAFLSPIPPFAIASKDDNTYTPETAPTSEQTERIPQALNPSALTSVVRVDVERPYGLPYLKATLSNGETMYDYSVDTTIESMLLTAIHKFPGFASGTNVQSLKLYRFRIDEIVSMLAPSLNFTNGDYLSITNVFPSITEEHARWDNGKLIYTFESGSDRTMTFNYDGSWSTDYIYSTTSSITITLYVARTITQYSVDVETMGSLGYIYTNSQNFYEYELDTQGMKTTDTSEVTVIDMNGLPIATSPWGLDLGILKGRVIVTSVSAYVEYRSGTATYAHADGLVFTVPLQPVDIASNSWVDYVYSGQREYDSNQRKIASQQALVGAVIGSASGAVPNAIMGSIGPEGFGPGKAVGATLGVSLAGAVVDYATSQYFNDRLQKADEMLRAKQFDSITVPGGGWDWLWHGCEPGIITLVPDDYSLERFENDKTLNGINCSEPTADCSVYAQGNGPIRINSLVIHGNIPVEAKNYIKQRFDDGIRLITTNLVGDKPQSGAVNE